MSNFNVPYPVGNTLQRDHIQWPTITRAQITNPAVVAIYGELSEAQRDELWPVDLTLAQIMALCWRVRRWNFSGSASVNMIYEASVGGPKHIAGTATVDDTEIVTFAVAVEATRERDLVGQVIFNNTSPYKSLVNGGVGVKPGEELTSDWSTTSDINGDWTGSVPIGFGMVAGFYLFDADSKLFSAPFQRFGTLIPADGPGNQLILSVTPFRNPLTVSSAEGPASLNAPGLLTIQPGILPAFTVPLQLAWRLQFEEPGSSLSGSGSGDFTLEATEFWRYSNTLGQDIYNADTGTPTGADPFA